MKVKYVEKQLQCVFTDETTRVRFTGGYCLYKCNDRQMIIPLENILEIIEVEDE